MGGRLSPHSGGGTGAAYLPPRSPVFAAIALGLLSVHLQTATGAPLTSFLFRLAPARPPFPVVYADTVTGCSASAIYASGLDCRGPRREFTDLSVLNSPTTDTAAFVSLSTNTSSALYGSCSRIIRLGDLGLNTSGFPDDAALSSVSIRSVTVRFGSGGFCLNTADITVWVAGTNTEGSCFAGSSRLGGGTSCSAVLGEGFSGTPAALDRPDLTLRMVGQPDFAVMVGWSIVLLDAAIVATPDLLVEVDWTVEVSLSEISPTSTPAYDVGQVCSVRGSGFVTGGPIVPQCIWTDSGSNVYVTVLVISSRSLGACVSPLNVVDPGNITMHLSFDGGVTLTNNAVSFTIPAPSPSATSGAPSSSSGSVTSSVTLSSGGTTSSGSSSTSSSGSVSSVLTSTSVSVTPTTSAGTSSTTTSGTTTTSGSVNSDSSEGASSEGGSPLILIVVLCIVAFCCVLIAAAAILFLIHRRRRTKGSDESTSATAVEETQSSSDVELVAAAGLYTDFGASDGTDPGSSSSVPLQYARFAPYAPTTGDSSLAATPAQNPTYASLRDVRAGIADLVGIQDPENLSRNKEIGRGQYGVVYRGKYHERTVAIKHLLENYGEQEMAEFLSEAELMKSIKPHPNVVGFVGFATLPGTNAPAIVVDFAAGGALEDALERDGPLSSAAAVAMFLGIARGMCHLAAANIVHRDLASRNVLLDKKNHPLVADFGLARLAAPDDASKTKSNTGPVRWMAPEALERHYSEKSDVWMFGATLVEGLTAADPFPGMSNIEAAVVVVQGGSPDIPEDADKIFHDVAKMCFVHKPKERASFADLVKVLEHA